MSLRKSISVLRPALLPAHRTRPWISLSRTTILQKPAYCSGKPWQVRSYAVARVRKTGPNHSEVFNLSEVPLSSFEAVIARNGDAFLRLTAAGYYECAQKFSEAISRGSNPWSITTTSIGISPEVAHETACIMRQIPGPRSADAFATALWASASDSGYRISTLSLARQLVRSGAFGRVPALKKVESRFKQLVSTTRDPDALMVEAELLYEQASYDGAIRLSQRALAVGASGFEWKPYCQLCLGKAYVKTQKLKEARSLFESLSEEGLVEADIELGNLLRSSDRDAAERHFFAAASNGRGDMFARLSEIASERATESGVDKGEKEDSIRWAKEWSQLADPRVEY